MAENHPDAWGPVFTRRSPGEWARLTTVVLLGLSLAASGFAVLTHSAELILVGFGLSGLSLLSALATLVSRTPGGGLLLGLDLLYNAAVFGLVFGNNLRKIMGLGHPVSGRPFRAGGEARTSPAAAAESWAAPLTLEAPADREELASAWLRDAAEEHASVAAFSRLSLQLLALGAPPELVDGCHAAARDEVAHARGAYAIAAALAGRALGPAPWPEALAPAARTDLLTLAVESLRDGCLNEGFAAALAQAGAEGAVEPVRAHLARVAEDEGRHAELGWAVLAWCLERGGPEVAEAVQAELARVPVTTDDAELPPGWARFGRVGGRAQARAYAAVRAELRARLRSVLASRRAA